MATMFGSENRKHRTRIPRNFTSP